MNKTLFLVFSAAILIFAIISICSAPIINGVITESSGWRTNNCKQLADEYDSTKSESDKKARNLCNRQKAMYGLEYSSLILDVTLGFICAILGLLHFFDVGKYFEKVSGIIGLATGIITFVLTLVYICYSGYIFTKDKARDYENSSSSILKLNGDGIFAEKEGIRYKCIYFDKDDKDAIYAKYNDLGKKQYNYQKKRHYDANSEYSNSACVVSAVTHNCGTDGYTYSSTGLIGIFTGCDNLYGPKFDSFENKYVYDRWVTTYIFCCFIIACSIGLAIFGFLLFKNSGNSGI